MNKEMIIWCIPEIKVEVFFAFLLSGAKYIPGSTPLLWALFVGALTKENKQHHAAAPGPAA